MNALTTALPHPAPTSTGEAAEELQPARVQHERKPALPGLTGIRTLLALTIILFHFTPAGLRWDAHPWVSLYPIVDIGYVFVSFFFLISGFILSYNYADRPGRMNAVDFWMARFSRLYPVYVLTLLISYPMLMTEWHVRSHRHFLGGRRADAAAATGHLPAPGNVLEYRDVDALVRGDAVSGLPVAAAGTPSAQSLETAGHLPCAVDRRSGPAHYLCAARP